MRFKLIVLLFLEFLSVLLCAEANFSELMAEGKRAAERGEFDNALSNYIAAFQSAEKIELKAEALFARNRFLLQNKKNADAEKCLKEFLQEDSLPPLLRRKTLCLLAGQTMWSRPNEAKQYLEQAITIPAVNINDQAGTDISMGHIYLINKQPAHALDIWLGVMEMKQVHPAYVSGVACQIGLLYRKMNDLENARKYFQMSVDNGKKVKYNFDYSGAEKALKELNERK